MKKWITGCFIAALISGCSTAPTARKPHPEKFTFQVVGVQIPDSALQKHEIDFGDNSNKIYYELENSQIPLISNIEFEKLIQYPTAKLIEFPIVVATSGERVINDQQEQASFPFDYQIVEGKLVPEEEEIGLGLLTAVTVGDVKDGVISFDIIAEDRKFKKWENHPTEAGNAKMPYFSMRSIDTKLTQKFNSWLIMSGLSNEGIDYMLAIRVLPPATWK